MTSIRPAPPTAPAAPAIPAAKLSPPGTPAAPVTRARIAEQVRAAGAVRLVLVRAPAGFGKTTAMQQLRAQREADGLATAWLTLDAADNDLPRFLAGLAAAVMQLGVEMPGPGEPLDAPALLAREETPFALFLDDLEAIHDPAVWGLLRELIAVLPRRSQLFIASRSLPDLGLGRLRARGQLLEIDAERLRFSRDEAAEFFRLRSGRAWPAQTLGRLHEKTEGWITAMWLAAMALDRRAAADEAAAFVEGFSGTDHALADYLAEDVLAQQPPEVRAFLLRTSILRQLDEAACRALQPRADVARLLQHLQAMHLFLTPIAGDEAHHRYHPLFAGFLRARLAREHPDEVARLHLAASGWYESERRPVPAIDHAIDGGDHPHALHLLGQHAEAFLEQGRMRLLDRWFAALPAEPLRARPLLQVVAVWAQCFTHGPWQAMRTLEDAGCAAVDDAAVQAHVNALRPLLLAMMDRHEDARDAGHASLARLPSCRPFADSVLANAMAHIVSVMGEPHEAHRLLDAARRTQHGSRFNRMYTESMEGLLDLKEGRLRQATARFRMAVGTTPHARPPTHSLTHSLTQGNAWAGVLYASAVYEANELDAAEHLLNAYGPLAREVGLPDHMIASHRMRARIAFQRGDVDTALQLLIELEYLGQQRQLPRVVASAKLERARLLLLQGHAQAAADELHRADDAALWERVRRQQLLAHEVDDLPIGRLRWQIHFGDARAAVASLARAVDEARHESRHHRALKLRLLHALALARSGEPDAAATDALLRDACREGFLRLVLDEGPIVANLLSIGPTTAARHDDPIFGAWLQRLAELLGGAVPADEPDATPDDGLAEPLTRKEIRVLQLLAEGYSNGAMAEKLFVSDSTVRTHLRNINLKLGARSRTQAVALARRAGVIR